MLFRDEEEKTLYYIRINFQMGTNDFFQCVRVVRWQSPNRAIHPRDSFINFAADPLKEVQ